MLKISPFISGVKEKAWGICYSYNEEIDISELHNFNHHLFLLLFSTVVIWKSKNEDISGIQKSYIHRVGREKKTYSNNHS